MVILLNQDALGSDDAIQFSSYVEKVIDVNLVFAPTPSQSAEIALRGAEGGDKLKAIVSDYCIQLGIDNIRVIQRIMQAANEVAPGLAKYKPGVLKSVISSLVLFGWSYHQPEIAPPLGFIKTFGQYLPSPARPDPERETLNERWGKILQHYGYYRADQLDHILIAGIQNGYFESNALTPHAQLLELREATKEAQIELDAPWQMFHGTFKDNIDEMVAEFLSCVGKNVRYYSLNTIISIVDLLQRLNRESDAQKIFDLFAASREGDPDAFDLGRLARFGQVLPPHLLEAVKAIKAKSRPVLTVDQLFLSLKQDGFGSETASKLAALPAEEYVRVLRSYEGDNLAVIRAGLIDYVDVSNPNPAAVAIMNKAADALKLIAGDDPLGNARIGSWRLVQWQKGSVAREADQERSD